MLILLAVEVIDAVAEDATVAEATKATEETTTTVEAVAEEATIEIVAKEAILQILEETVEAEIETAENAEIDTKFSSNIFIL